MSGRIRLRPAERKALLGECRRGTDPDRRLRAHVLLLLDDGHPWALIAAVLFTSSSTINRWRRRYRGGGARRGTGPPLPAAARLVAGAGGADGPHPHPGRLRPRPQPLDLRGGRRRAGGGAPPGR